VLRCENHEREASALYKMKREHGYTVYSIQYTVQCVQNSGVESSCVVFRPISGVARINPNFRSSLLDETQPFDSYFAPVMVFAMSSTTL